MDRNFTNGIADAAMWRVIGLIIVSMLLGVGVYKLGEYLINHLHILWN